jgi:hypothetical protein
MSDLEHRVQRLALQLDQRIYRLERMRDLITGLLQVSIALRQSSREHKHKLDFAIQRGMTFPELDALVKVVDDELLIGLKDQLFEILNSDIWPKMWNLETYDLQVADELIMTQSAFTLKMHLRILVLWEEATRANEF